MFDTSSTIILTLIGGIVMVKKTLSLSLIALFLFQAVHFNLCTSYAWSFPWENNKASENLVNACEKKNKYNELADLTCAVSKLKKDLRTKGTQEMLKVGKNGEYNLYMWDYLHLDKFLTTMVDFLETAKSGHIQTGAAINLTNEVSGLLNIDTERGKEVLANYLNDNVYYKFTKEEISELIDQILNKAKGDKSAINTVGAIGSVVGGLACTGFAKWLTLATAGVLGVGALGAVGIGGACYSAMSWWKSSTKSEQLKKHDIEIQNYSSALKQLLEDTQEGKWKYADSVLAQLNFDPEYYNTQVLMVDSRIKYTEEAKKEFNQIFKTIETKLRQMIGENKNLDRRIDL